MKISTALLVIAAFLVVCDIAAAQTVREVFEVEKKSFWSGTEGLYRPESPDGMDPQVCRKGVARG